MTRDTVDTKLSDNVDLREWEDGEMRIRFCTDDGYYHAAYLLADEVKLLYEHLKVKFEALGGN